MKKLMQILMIVGLMLAVLSITAFAHTAGDPFVTDLTVGGGNIKSAEDIGDVLVWNDGEYLYVQYVVTNGDWCLTETHLEVALALEDFPLTKTGSPKIGHFTYGASHDCVGDATYTIPITWPVGTELLIGAHGVASTGGFNGITLTLPLEVTMATTYPGLGFGAPSYFDITISGGTFLDGTYDGYCVDIGTGLLDYGQAIAYNSYGPLPPSIFIDFPENLDLVNWLVNQDFVGQPSACGGNYTFGDVQAAIWMLVEGQIWDNGSLKEWSPCRAQEIIDAAMANGEGYMPGCGEKLVIVLDPVLWRQPAIIWIDMPCDGRDETAWGGDYFGSPLEFPGSDWSIYFAYTVQ